MFLEASYPIFKSPPWHNGGNYRFCARLKVPPFPLKYEWQFWSKFSSVAISLKKMWVPSWVIANIFYYWCTKTKSKWPSASADGREKTIDISDQGKFRQQMSLYLTSWHILSQLEVGFITVFHSWRNCELQMFCVFLSLFLLLWEMTWQF
jgi:hypothetical protein